MYNVKGPGHLWHADGCHKLRRWGFVVHAAIDGFSRTITFIRCSDNNRAVTVLDGFLEGVRRYGCPSRLRTDRGGENVAIADYMIMTRGANRNSAIFGSSTHNQRIERLWRDVTKEVLDYYRVLFHFIEDYFDVNISEDWVMFLIHYMFMSAINNDLQQFQRTWNNHPLRTENNRSPHQLLRCYASSSEAVVDAEEYGVEELLDDAYIEDGDNQVVVDPMQCPFNNEDYRSFSENVEAFSSSIGLSDETILDKFRYAVVNARRILT